MNVRPRTLWPMIALPTLMVVTVGLSSYQPSWATGDPGLSTNRATALSTCFWRGPVDSKRNNNAFPDTAVTYWAATISLPAGSQLGITGQFPHSRYMSFNAYDQAGVATDHIDDAAVVPPKGSTNPFLPGANRTAAHRNYSVTVLNQVPPSNPATNTVYAGVSGQTTEVLIYRVYVPDKGSDSTGGVGLPRVSVLLANNTVLTSSAMCKAVSAKASLPPSQKFPLSTYLSLRDQAGQSPRFPALNPPTFWRVFNVTALVGCIYHGSCGGTPALSPGQYSNLDNAYVIATVNRGFSAGPVLVLRGKMPTTPSTFDQNSVMGSDTQVRYWSVCQNESLATTRVAACLYDEQVPLDKSRNYTIVSSLPSDRPANATTKCGVGWIAWPAKGDGAGHLKDGTLILRNVLPSSSFTAAIQNVAQPGQESVVMGSYLPIGQYTTKAAFQALGCPLQGLRGAQPPSG